MHLYWVYDLPNWLFGSLVVGFFVAFAAIGLATHRRFILKIFGRHPHNDMVSYYLAAVGVFYGITLGLISVGTYTTFSEIDAEVSLEATTLGAIYNDVGSYPEPTRSILRQHLNEYTNIVIDISWPLQRKGETGLTGFEKLREINSSLSTFEPVSPREQIIHAEVFRQFNQLLELNNSRLQSVNSGLPMTMYVVIVVGALLNIMVSWLFIIDNFRLHNALNILMAALLGLLVFLIAVMDNPYRGDYSVGPDAFEFVRDRVINSQASPGT
jgi:hypothetical protein